MGAFTNAGRKLRALEETKINPKTVIGGVIPQSVGTQREKGRVNRR